MEQKLLSIYIGNDVIRVCEAAKKSSSSIVIKSANEVQTPQGAVDDGYITDIPAVAEAIMSTNMGRRYQASRVIFTIASRKVLSKEIVTPYLRGDKKMLAVIEANSSDYFPTTAGNKYIYAYKIMEPFMDEEGKKLRVNATAAPYDLVSTYYKLADELKLTVENIDYVSNSVLSLLSLQLHDTDTELIIQIEKDVTYVNIMAGKDVLLQRVVTFGKNTVVNFIMESRGLNRVDAQSLLNKKDELYQTLSAAEYSEIVSSLVNSIRRIVEYHIGRNPDRIIDSIIVFGEGSAIAGIDEILEKELGSEVTRFDSLQGVKISAKSNLSAKKVLRYLTVFGALFSERGLCIGQESDFDDYGEGQKSYIGMLIAFGVVILIMAAIVAVVEVKYSGKQSYIATLEESEKQLSEYEKLAMTYSKETKEYNDILSFDNATHSDNTMIVTFIDDLERLLPEGVRFERIRSVDGAVTFHVIAPSKACVVDMLNEIEKLEYVTSVNVPGLEADFLEDDELANAQMEAQNNALANGATLEESLAIAQDVQSVEVSYDFNCIITDPYYEPESFEVFDVNALPAESVESNTVEEIAGTEAEVNAETEVSTETEVGTEENKEEEK